MTDGRGVVSPLLQGGLTPDEERSVASRAVSRRLRKGQILFREGEPAEALYQVQTGRLRLSQVTPAGEAVTVRFTGPGEVCAALAVLDGKAYPFTATAVLPTLVILWNRSSLRELLQLHPRFERNVLDVVGVHAREVLDKFRELATEPVPRRLARALLRLLRLGRSCRDGGVLIEHVRQRDLAELASTPPLHRQPHPLGVGVAGDPPEAPRRHRDPHAGAAPQHHGRVAPQGSCARVGALLERGRNSGRQREEDVVLHVDVLVHAPLQFL